METEALLLSMLDDVWDKFDRDDMPVGSTVRGALWRIALSVVIPVVWLSSTLIYLGFFAHGLTLGQDLVVGIVSVLALFGALVAVWISFGFRVMSRWAHL